MIFFSVNTLMNNKTKHLCVWWCFELLQFSNACWSPRFLLKHGSNLLKCFAFGLRDTEINEHCEAKKQHRKQEEHITIQPNLVRITKKEVRSSVIERSSKNMMCIHSWSAFLPGYKEKSWLWWSYWSSCSSLQEQWQQVEALGWTAQLLWTMESDQDRSQRNSQRGR